MDGLDASNRLLGGIGLNHINAQAKYANLGYWVRSTATGRGVAPAAVRLLVEWAFSETDLQRLEIVAAVGNEKSQRVAEKVGAVREGILKSKVCVFGQFHAAVMYAVLRGE